MNFEFDAKIKKKNKRMNFNNLVLKNLHRFKV